MKKDYWVDFQASIKVRASNEEEAKETALQILDSINSGPEFDNDHLLDYVNIDYVEEG